jgi:hypothetical protein
LLNSVTALASCRPALSCLCSHLLESRVPAMSLSAGPVLSRCSAVPLALPMTSHALHLGTLQSPEPSLAGFSTVLPTAGARARVLSPRPAPADSLVHSPARLLPDHEETPSLALEPDSLLFNPLLSLGQGDHSNPFGSLTGFPVPIE